MRKLSSLREGLGRLWRNDPERIRAEEERLAKLKEERPEHYHHREHLWGAQWYRGGPISQKDLAAELGACTRAVERWETGEAYPGGIARKALDRLWEAVEGRS